MLPKIQPALSDYYSGNAEPLATRIFKSIWDGFSPEKSGSNFIPKTLDLGKAQPDSFDFYSEHNCYLTIADCIAALVNLSWPEADNPNITVMKNIEAILDIPTKEYDLILVWDSFNYIHPKILPFIHNHLLNFCTKKTIIHGFSFTSESYPKEPGIFKILETNKIQHAVTTDKVIQHLPLTPLAINKVMPNFKYTRSVLMRSGLQEFMLMRK